uniref:Uncharacterized protein n=1 Tax=Opuntia streptacantha TaxID=393608 RepID=A0A7C9DUN4_OPUST
MFSLCVQLPHILNNGEILFLVFGTPFALMGVCQTGGRCTGVKCNGCIHHLAHPLRQHALSCYRQLPCHAFPLGVQPDCRCGVVCPPCTWDGQSHTPIGWPSQSPLKHDNKVVQSVAISGTCTSDFLTSRLTSYYLLTAHYTHLIAYCSTPQQPHIPSVCMRLRFFAQFSHPPHSPTSQCRPCASQISSPTSRGAH